MKKEIANVVDKLNKLDINNPEEINNFKVDLNNLAFEDLEDQHPYNARLILLNSLDALEGKEEGPVNSDFDWCRDFFKRAMTSLYADLNNEQGKDVVCE